jgi:hypothetical protein
LCILILTENYYIGTLIINLGNFKEKDLSFHALIFLINIYFMEFFLRNNGKELNINNINIEFNIFSNKILSIEKFLMKKIIEKDTNFIERIIQDLLKVYFDDFKIKNKNKNKNKNDEDIEIDTDIDKDNIYIGNEKGYLIPYLKNEKTSSLIMKNYYKKLLELGEELDDYNIIYKI